MILISFLNGICSRNVSLRDSEGYTPKTDPAYTNIPLASPRPPEAVDPSGESSPSSMLNETNQDASFQMVPYFFCSSLNRVPNARHRHRTDWYSIVDEYNTRFFKIAAFSLA